jgi:hypothetical protein
MDTCHPLGPNIGVVSVKRRPRSQAGFLTEIVIAWNCVPMMLDKSWYIAGGDHEPGIRTPGTGIYLWNRPFFVLPERGSLMPDGRSNRRAIPGS